MGTITSRMLTKHKLDISCIILSADNQLKGNCLNSCVQSLLNQKNVGFEIIIIDAGIKPINKKHIIKLFKNTAKNNINIPFTILRVSTSASRGKARNIGAKQARSDILVFIDDDTIVLTNTALAYIKKNSEKYSHGYGAKRLWTRGNWFNKNSSKVEKSIRNKKYSILLANSSKLKSKIRGVYPEFANRSFIGNFGFISKPLFQSISGFPDYKYYGFEDDCLAFEAYLKSKLFLNLENIKVIHINHLIENKSTEKNIGKYYNLLVSKGYNWFNIGRLLNIKKCLNQPILQKLRGIENNYVLVDLYYEYLKIYPLNKLNEAQKRYWARFCQLSLLDFMQVVAIITSSKTIDDLFSATDMDLDNLAPVLRALINLQFLRIENNKIIVTNTLKPYKLKSLAKAHLKKPKANLNQFPCDYKSAQARIKLFRERFPYADYIRVGLIGDDDLISLHKGCNNFLYFTILEKDRTVIDESSKVPHNKVIKADLQDLDFVPKESFDWETFITDPPYTINGALTFIYQGLRFLNKDPRLKEFYLILNTEMIGERLLYIQNVLSKAGVWIHEIRPHFSHYMYPVHYSEYKRAKTFWSKNAPRIRNAYSSSSSLFIFRTRKPKLDVLRQYINTSRIYRHYGSKD